MRKLIVVTGLLLCFGVSQAFSQCSLAPVASFCGSLQKRSLAPPYATFPQSIYSVKFCRTDLFGADGGGGRCVTGSTHRSVDYYGTVTYSDFYATGLAGDDSYHQFYAFAWSDAEFWGSRYIPIEIVSVNNFYDGSQISMLSVPPRPLPPTPLAPANGTIQTETAFPVKWRSGVDAVRVGFAMSYDVYYKYWALGDLEPKSYTLSAAGMACNPDANGDCGTFVSNEPIGNYRWKVVAHLNARPLIPRYMTRTDFTTESDPSFFTIRTQGRPPGCCR